MSDFQVIATLNFHLLSAEMLRALAENGATIFRINGSHVQPPEIERYSNAIRAALGDKVKILLDLPGNKIRTAVLSQPIVISAGKTFEIDANQLNYPKFISHLSVGDILLANDSLFKFRVEEVHEGRVVLFSYSDGLLTSNKGIHLTGKHPPLPFLFARDYELIREAVKQKLDFIGLSFVRTAADVDEAKTAISGSALELIVKVETAPAVENLGEILKKADKFLVDRGDLSCDVGIEFVDHFQKLILRRALQEGKKVFFATQFLHSMLHNNVPLIAEACGLSDAIRNGVHGIQLSEETAVGKYPIEVLKTVRRIRSASRPEFRFTKNETSTAPVLWLTGRSGSGKTTLAKMLAAEVEAMAYTCCIIDGDDFRSFWGNDLGYTKEDRLRNLRNITFTAYQASKSFDLVIVSSLSPYRELREFARGKIAGFHEIYIDCPQDVCQIRDPKGHYKKAKDGQHKNFVGVTEEYEVPSKPELTVQTNQITIEEAFQRLRNYLFAV